MGETSERERLRQLGERIAALKGEAPKTQAHPDEHGQAQFAWRMVTELVAGLLVGFGIGYGLDALFGTRPWLMLLFTLLGFAAGVQTMLRTAREMQRTPQGGTDQPSAPHDKTAGATPAPDGTAGATPAPDNTAGPAPAQDKTAGPTPAEGQREDARRG